MPFIALCPHCRSVKVKAPTRKRGMLHTCPKCAAEFALEPEAESSLPVEYKLPPVEYDLDEAYREAATDDFASARTVVQRPMDTVTDVPSRDETPSAILPVIEPTVNTTAVQQIDYTPNMTKPDPPLMLALASGSMLGVAMILTQIPYGRIIALPILIVGAILGLLSLPGLEGRKNYGYGAISLNGMGLLLVLFLPSWLGLNTWVPEGDPNAGAKPALSVPRDGSPPSPASGVDALKAVWKQDDVRVEVSSIRVEFLDPAAKKVPANATPPKKVLRIGLKVGNVGVARAVTLNGWPPDAGPKLNVANGAIVPFTQVETTLPIEVKPGKEAEIVLQYEVPPTLADSLMLEMPGAGFSASEPVKFAIPAAMIAKPVNERQP